MKKTKRKVPQNCKGITLWRRWEFECLHCHDDVFVEQNNTDFPGAVKEAESNGWRILRKKNEYDVICPSCYQNSDQYFQDLQEKIKVYHGSIGNDLVIVSELNLGSAAKLVNIPEKKFQRTFKRANKTSPEFKIGKKHPQAVMKKPVFIDGEPNTNGEWSVQ